MIFEIKTVDSEPFTVTKSKKTGTTYIAKGNPKTKSGKEKEQRSKWKWKLRKGEQR